MPARIPNRLAGPAQLANAAATLYTTPNPSSLPAGMTAKTIVRHIHLFNNDTATAYKATLSITADGATKRILDAYSIAASSPYDSFPYYILAAGEIVQGFADTASKITYIIDGDEIILGG